MASPAFKDERKVVPVVGVRLNPSKTVGLLYGRLACLDSELAEKVDALYRSFTARKEEHGLLSMEIGSRTGRWNSRMGTFDPAGPNDPFMVTVVTKDWKGIIL